LELSLDVFEDFSLSEAAKRGRKPSISVTYQEIKHSRLARRLLPRTIDNINYGQKIASK
jgi:hypothetical protein